jgi:hypothetical protein
MCSFDDDEKYSEKWVASPGGDRVHFHRWFLVSADGECSHRNVAAIRHKRNHVQWLLLERYFNSSTTSASSPAPTSMCSRIKSCIPG